MVVLTAQTKKQRYLRCFSLVLIMINALPVPCAAQACVHQAGELAIKIPTRQELATQIAALGDTITFRENELMQLQQSSPDTVGSALRAHQLRMGISLRVLEFRTQEEQRIEKKLSLLKSQYDYDKAALSADEQQTYAQIDNILSERQRLVNDVTHLNELRNKLAAARLDERSAQDERTQILSELRSGLFCSQCKKSKSEIERQGEAFSVHLQRVSGVAIAIPEVIAQQRDEELSRRVQSARGLTAAVEAQLATAQQAHAMSIQANRDREKVAQDRLISLAARTKKVLDVYMDAAFAAHGERSLIDLTTRQRERELLAEADAADYAVSQAREVHEEAVNGKAKFVDDLKAKHASLYQMLQRYDDPLLRQIEAQRLAEQETAEGERLDQIIDGAIYAIEMDPSDVPAEKIGEIALAIIRRMGWNYSEQFAAEVEKEVLSTLQQRYEARMRSDKNSSAPTQ